MQTHAETKSATVKCYGGFSVDTKELTGRRDRPAFSEAPLKGSEGVSSSLQRSPKGAVPALDLPKMLDAAASRSQTTGRRSLRILHCPH